MGWIKSYWNNRPLTLILWIALVLRLIAVIFSKGYGMHDDHFLVIETAQSWLDGAAYNNWFLQGEHAGTPAILNFYYAGFHYLLFFLLERLGISDPQAKMYVVRFLHALWSLLIVFYGYKITEKLAGEKTARKTGLLLAALWLMPFFSVRNLVETVCVPFLMIGFWKLLESPSKKRPLLQVFSASIFFGLAFTLRYQTLIIPAGIGLVWFFQKKWKECMVLASGIILLILATQGVTDWIIWGRPFTDLTIYISHNISHRFDYTVSPWYTYLLVILGVLIPPVSLMLLAGFFNSWKKNALMFIPVFLFLVLHSYFPNKQERFILPIFPFLVILGMVGWEEIKERFAFWKKQKKLLSAFWIFFWIINLGLLAFFTPMYSKKARVEAMTYLSKYDRIKALVTEDVNRPYANMLPLFYLHQWPQIYTVSGEHPMYELRKDLNAGHPVMPSFVLFFDDRDLGKRVKNMRQLLPGLVPEKVIAPSLPDKLLHWLNPVNANETIFIFRNQDIVPHKL